MAVSNNFYLMVAGCALVTWIPRIVPFLLAKKIAFPKLLLDFLEYVPLCILFALLLDALLLDRPGKVPLFSLIDLAAGLPTLLVALKTQDLMKTVIVGILTMALFRLIF